MKKLILVILLVSIFMVMTVGEAQAIDGHKWMEFSEEERPAILYGMIYGAVYMSAVYDEEEDFSPKMSIVISNEITWMEAQLAASFLTIAYRNDVISKDLNLFEAIMEMDK